MFSYGWMTGLMAALMAAGSIECQDSGQGDRPVALSGFPHDIQAEEADGWRMAF